MGCTSAGWFPNRPDSCAVSANPRIIFECLHSSRVGGLGTSAHVGQQGFAPLVYAIKACIVRFGRIATERIRSLHFRLWLCVTSIAGPHGGAQLYER